VTQPHDEIPSDDTVVELLRGRGPMWAPELIAALSENYDQEDARRAVRRCMNRGLIQLTDDLSLEAAGQLAEAA